MQKNKRNLSDDFNKITVKSRPKIDQIKEKQSSTTESQKHKEIPSEQLISKISGTIKTFHRLKTSDTSSSKSSNNSFELEIQCVFIIIKSYRKKTMKLLELK